jgi:hypothetical protein
MWARETLLRDDHTVAERGAAGGPARRAEYYGDLRHLVGDADHSGEHVAGPLQRRHVLRKPGAIGAQEPDLTRVT